MKQKLRNTISKLFATKRNYGQKKGRPTGGPLQTYVLREEREVELPEKIENRLGRYVCLADHCVAGLLQNLRLSHFDDFSSHVDVSDA